MGGQTTFLPEPAVAAVAARAHPPRGRPRPGAAVGADVVAVHTEQVETEDLREAGPVHVGHQLWRALELDRILEEAGLSARAQRLTELMTLNRLVHPASEHAMPDWIRRTALADLLGADFSTLSDEALYRAATPAVTGTPYADKKPKAEQLDGGYLLKTDRQDLGDEEIWRLYILLTRVEDAFRAMKSPLLERPIFHHVEPWSARRRSKS